MKLDQELFKHVLGRGYDVKDEKDLMTAIALHYFCNQFGIFDVVRDYGFILTDKGVLSPDCMRDVLAERKGSFSGKFTEYTENVLSSLEIALESTAEILKRPFDERDAIISAAAYKYVKSVYCSFHEDDEEMKKKEFESHFPAGDYELGKTCDEQAEIVFESIIESERQAKLKKSQTSGENEG